MSAIAKKYRSLPKSAQIIRVAPEIWKKNKQHWYVWAKLKCHKYKLSDDCFDVAEIIINCANMKQMTVASKETLLNRYKARHPHNKMSLRKLYQILNLLEKAKIIKRYEQQSFYATGAIRILAPKLAVLCVQNLQTNNLKTNIEAQSAPPSPSAAALLAAKQEEEIQKWKEDNPISSLDDIRKMLTPRRK